MSIQTPMKKRTMKVLHLVMILKGVVEPKKTCGIITSNRIILPKLVKIAHLGIRSNVNWETYILTQLCGRRLFRYVDRNVD